MLKYFLNNSKKNCRKVQKSENYLFDSQKGQNTDVNLAKVLTFRSNFDLRAIKYVSLTPKFSKYPNPLELKTIKKYIFIKIQF